MDVSQNKKILIIDDSPQDRKIMIRYLSKAGFGNLSLAETGEQGLELAVQENPDIILLDTMLPGIDGFQTCEQLKKVKQVQALVIMMTGQVDAVNAEKAKSVGADDYCAKTSDCSVILEAIQKSTGTAIAPTEKPYTEDLENEKKTDDIPRGKTNWEAGKTEEVIRQLSKELAKKNEELKELDELKSKFVSMVSHELKTPLTIINAAISQVLEGIYGPVTDAQKKKMVMALNGTERLKRMINDILDFSKLEARQVQLNKTKINIIDVVKEIYAAFSSLIKNKGMELKMSSSQKEIFVEADRDRIIQIFTNLVGNSLKFTEQGSIEISVIEKAEHVECSVVDTGKGIAEQDLPKVFGRFQQFGDLARTKNEGTGLGLSICKDIIELHQGTIHVESQAGKGSKFIFTLPR